MEMTCPPVYHIGKLWYAHTKGCFTLNHWCPCMLPWVSGRPQVPHDRSWRWAERRLCTADREPESGPSLRCSTMTQNPRLTSYLQLKPCESLTISWVLIFLISIVCGHKCISPMNCNVISSKHNIYFFLCNETMTSTLDSLWTSRLYILINKTKHYLSLQKIKYTTNLHPPLQIISTNLVNNWIYQ